jgi:hypothetical protein
MTDYSIKAIDRLFAKPSAADSSSQAEMTVHEAFDIWLGGRVGRRLAQAEQILEADRTAQVACEALVDEITELKRSRLRLTASEAALEAKAEAQTVIRETSSYVDAAAVLTKSRDELKAKRA